ncbi:hypothetical protein GH733_004234, partial [Mirounga leonina]
MVTSSSFSTELKKEVLLLRKNCPVVPSRRWRLSKDRDERTGEKYTALKTHTEERTPAWRNQRYRLFPEEPIGARPGGWLPSAPSGQEDGGPPEKRRRCNSRHAVPKRHTLELPQETFALFLWLLSAIPATCGQITRLYSRFTSLDKGENGTL